MMSLYSLMELAVAPAKVETFVPLIKLQFCLGLPDGHVKEMCVALCKPDKKFEEIVSLAREMTRAQRVVTSEVQNLLSALRHLVGKEVAAVDVVVVAVAAVVVIVTYQTSFVVVVNRRATMHKTAPLLPQSPRTPKTIKRSLLLLAVSQQVRGVGSLLCRRRRSMCGAPMARNRSRWRCLIVGAASLL
jgi:hypothetical protein